jgi:hypothetical protein
LTFHIGIVEVLKRVKAGIVQINDLGARHRETFARTWSFQVSASQLSEQTPSLHKRPTHRHSDVGQDVTFATQTSGQVVVAGHEAGISA